MRNLQLGLFYIVAVSGVTVIGYIMAGWASDNKYALLGAVRSAAQLISYEIPLILAVLAVSMVAGSLNLNDIILQQHNVPNIVLQPLPFVILLTATLAELSRRPFDIPIGESELVGGPWVEYSGIRWSIIFALSEYAGLWGMSILASLVFLGGWEWPFGTRSWWGDYAFLYQLALIFVKSFILILTIMWISATFPRLRIDQLMAFCWKILLPFGFLQVLINGIVLMYLNDSEAAARHRALPDVRCAPGGDVLRNLPEQPEQPSREERVGAVVGAEECCAMIGVLKSLGVTMSTMMRKPVTIQYPTVHRKVPERDRAFPILLWDFDSRRAVLHRLPRLRARLPGRVHDGDDEGQPQVRRRHEQAPQDHRRVLHRLRPLHALQHLRRGLQLRRDRDEQHLGRPRALHRRPQGPGPGPRPAAGALQDRSRSDPGCLRDA